VLIGDAVRDHEPKLSDGVHGGIFFPHEKHIDPNALMRGLHRRLLELGVQIVEHAPLAGVRTARDRIVEITAGEESFSADAYVLAAGAWTGPISKLMGVPLPVRPGKGYSIDTPAYDLRSSTNLSDAKVAVTPLSRNLRLAGTMEFGGLDEELNQIRVGAILAAPARYFRDWSPPSTALTPRAGIRPMTPDGKPVIGRLGTFANAYVSTGHGMQGITLGPGSAQALCTLVLRGELPDVLLPFSPDRFRRAAVRRRPATNSAQQKVTARAT
jgi:D-amino-acid dehydrogenase